MSSYIDYQRLEGADSMMCGVFEVPEGTEFDLMTDAQKAVVERLFAVRDDWILPIDGTAAVGGKQLLGVLMISEVDVVMGQMILIPDWSIKGLQSYYLSEGGLPEVHIQIADDVLPYFTGASSVPSFAIVEGSAPFVVA